MSWWKRAKPGDKVVCVDNTGAVEHGLTSSDFPKIGQIYTVEFVQPCRVMASRFELALIEMPEIYACVFNFRPLQKKSTEHQVNKLKSLLNGSPIKEDA